MEYIHAHTSKIQCTCTSYNIPYNVQYMYMCVCKYNTCTCIYIVHLICKLYTCTCAFLKLGCDGVLSLPPAQAQGPDYPAEDRRERGKRSTATTTTAAAASEYDDPATSLHCHGNVPARGSLKQATAAAAAAAAGSNGSPPLLLSPGIHPGGPQPPAPLPHPGIRPACLCQYGRHHASECFFLVSHAPAAAASGHHRSPLLQHCSCGHTH